MIVTQQIIKDALRCNALTQEQQEIANLTRARSRLACEVNLLQRNLNAIKREIIELDMTLIYALAKVTTEEISAQKYICEKQRVEIINLRAANKLAKIEAAKKLAEVTKKKNIKNN